MRRLPLFPLPVVLLPGAHAPLHVFEPRYQQLMAHCLENDRRFGLIYHDPDRDGPFDSEPGRVGCVAEIEHFLPLSEGRAMVKVHGVERFRIVDGIESDALYYEALVEEYPDLPEEAGELDRRARDSHALLHQVLEHVSEEPQPLPPLEEQQPVSFQLAQWVKIDPSWQQQLLEVRTEIGRLDLIDLLLHTALDPSD